MGWVKNFDHESCFSLENAIFELMNVKGSMISPILDDMFNLLYSKKL